MHTISVSLIASKLLLRSFMATHIPDQHMNAKETYIHFRRYQTHWDIISKLYVVTHKKSVEHKTKYIKKIDKNIYHPIEYTDKTVFRKSNGRSKLTRRFHDRTVNPKTTQNHSLKIIPAKETYHKNDFKRPRKKNRNEISLLQVSKPH